MGIIPDRYNPYSQAKALGSILKTNLGFMGLPSGQDLASSARGAFSGSLFGTGANPKSLFPSSTAAQTSQQQGIPELRDQLARQGDVTTSGDAGGIPIGDTGTFSTDAGSDVDRINAQLEAQRQAIIDSANRWADDLLKDAQGDKDFAVRQLDAEHKVALGQNDQARAEFLEKVADALEERIGTIPYDYERGITRLAQDKSRALERLARDETEARRQFGVETEQARVGQGESLSQRGLLTGPRDETVGLGAKSVSDLESEIAARFQTLERGINEPRQDIMRTSQRTGEDLKTQARRAGLKTERVYEFGKEAQERELERRRKEIERDREIEKLTAEAFQFTGVTN